MDRELERGEEQQGCVKGTGSFSGALKQAAFTFFFGSCRMLRVQRSPAWSTITNEGRSDLKKVGSAQD